MPSQLPCPNPTCKHTFLLAEVHAATALTCPVCGQVFQFRADAEAGIKPQPLARAVRNESGEASPHAKPGSARSKPVYPVAMPVGSASPGPPPAKPREMAPTVAQKSGPNVDPFNTIGADSPFGGARRRRRGRWRFLMPIVAIVIAVGVVAGAYLVFYDSLVRRRESVGPSAPVHNLIVTISNQKNGTEKACRLILAEKSWRSDTELRQRLGVALAYKFHDPADSDKVYWCAVHAKDFGMFRPGEGELLRLGIDRLTQHFGDTLETDAKSEPAFVNKRAAQRLTFKGQVNSVIWWGDMYFLTQHGIGLWLFVAAPGNRDEAQEAFKEIHTSPSVGFFVETERRGWSEQPPPLNTFRGSDKLITVSAREGLFVEFDVKEEDERGVLFLLGRYLKEQDNRKNAHVVMLTLDKKGDLKGTFKAARDYVEELKQKESGEYKLKPIEETKEGDFGTASDVGSQRGRIGEFQVQFKDEIKRYLLLAVVNQGETAFAIRCECHWESRAIWRQEFLELLATLKVKKAEE